MKKQNRSAFRNIKRHNTAEQKRKKNTSSWMSVGLKMVIGVGIVTNLCIGALIFINFMTFSQVGRQTNALLDINAAMNDNLRAGIFDLQKKYLEIPSLLQVDLTQQVLEWLRSSYPVESEKTVTGRENFTELLNRSQRRDISKGLFVVETNEDAIIVSKGMPGTNQEIADAVLRIRIKSTLPNEDSRTIKDYIGIARNAENPDALKQKIAALKSLLADEALAAETARNEILYKTEELEKKKSALVHFRQEKLNTISLMAVLAIIINLVMVHFVTWFVVESPLKLLTRTIAQIHDNKETNFPFQKRKDSIGILARTLKNFQVALIHLRQTDERKKAEQKIIHDVIRKMTDLIRGLEKKANTMKENAMDLTGAASNSKHQTENATASATRTVDQTHMVSTGVKQLQNMAKEIRHQTIRQNDLVKTINTTILASKNDINGLRVASTQITDIIAIVKNIAEETKLLALNARIEAARAGTAGKGFTVVAQEVRELSLQTETANQEIGNKIQLIQGASHTMINNTQEIESRINRLMEASGQIAAAIEKQSTVTAGIAENTCAATHEITDVSEQINQVSDTVHTTGLFAKDVQQYSHEIADDLSYLLAETIDKLSRISMLTDDKDTVRDCCDLTAGTVMDEPFSTKGIDGQNIRAPKAA